VVLDTVIRAGLEKSIDDILKDIEDSEKTYSIILEAQGIESSLETILSFIAGITFGRTSSAYIIKHGRQMNKDEMIAFVQLLKRRAWEIREAFIRTRII